MFYFERHFLNLRHASFMFAPKPKKFGFISTTSVPFNSCKALSCSDLRLASASAFLANSLDSFSKATCSVASCVVLLAAASFSRDSFFLFFD